MALPPLLATRTSGVQLVTAVVVPAVFGAISGVVLGWSAAVYWTLQALATIGGVLGGLEHDGAGSGAQRGLCGGLLFGSFLLLASAITGAEPRADLGDAPGFLVVITGLVGCLMGALGGHLRGRSSASPA